MTSSEILIFLGPSLPLKEAESILKARYFPPARQGDLLSLAVQLRPKAIGLIDGYFGQALSVWHKEILYVLSQGIAVLGASSMGALRAVEMEPCGMIGVGKVFELYQAGTLEDDDEVALSHGPPEEFLSFSLPLVNLRFTLWDLESKGMVSRDVSGSILSIAKSLYYPDRTWENIATEAKKHGVAMPIKLLQTHYIDQKREDAKLLLATIKKAPPPKQKETCSSSFFKIFYHLDRRRFSPSGSLSQRGVSLYTALHHPRFSEIQFHALNQALVSLLAQILKIEVTPEEMDQESARTKARLRWSDQEDWLKRNDLSKETFEELLRERAKARKLHRSLTLSSTPWKEVKYLLEELKWTGEYETWFEKALCQEEVLNEASCCYSETDLPNLPVEQLVDMHLRETSWNPDLLCSEWISEAGFFSVAEFQSEIVKAQIARNYLKNLLFQ